jgi:hypothetical protein
MTGDILEEGKTGTDLAEHSPNVRPEVTGIGGALSLSRERERLTRVATSDEIHNATPRLAVKGREIAPDRSPIQGRLRHPFHEEGRREGFPFDVAHTLIGMAQGETQPEFDASNPGT